MLQYEFSETHYQKISKLMMFYLPLQFEQKNLKLYIYIKYIRKLKLFNVTTFT